MAIEFPADKFVNDTFPYGGMTYVWDGEKWTASGAAAFEDAYVNKDGDTMTGDLTVPNLISEGDITADGDISGANGIFTGDVQTTSLNGGPLAGLRNVFINGMMEVSQRAETFTYTTTGIYTADRWYVSQGDNPTTITRTGEGFTNAVGITNWLSLTSVSPVLISQAIELPVVSSAGRSPFPVGQTYTVSCYATAGRAGQVNARWADGVDLGNASDGGTGGYKVMTETPVAGTDFSRYTYSFTIAGSPVASNRALVVTFSFASNGGKCQVSGFQLEPGSVATPLEMRPIGLELQLCQRYFYASKSKDYSYPTNSASGGQLLRITEKFPVEMQTSPTVSILGGTAIDRSTAMLQVTSGTNADGVNLQGTGAAGDGAMGYDGVFWIADAEL